MNYNLQLNQLLDQIREKNAKLVCIQMPDGLKPVAGDVQKEIEKNTSAKAVIWAGSCFGACDLPYGLENLGVDLLVQWGHSRC